MKYPLNKLALVAALAIIPALSSLAQPYYIAGSAITPNWTTTEPGAIPMSGGPAVYTITLPTAASAYHEFKAASSNWASSWPANNIKIKGDANGTNTFYFFPGTINDGWLPIANRVGYADPGTMAFEIVGDFNGWPGDGAFGTALTSLGDGVYSNSIVVATAGSHEFKIRAPGTWGDFAFGTDFGNFGANGTFTTTNSPQTVPVQLDLPNGRFVVGSLVPPPVTNQVVFAVDMSVEILLGRFDPAVNRVNVSGNFNNWPGTATNALILTNVPTYGGGANTNIYYGTATLVGTPSAFISEYKFTDDNAALNGSSGYEPRASNRSLSLLSSNGVYMLPVVTFGDTLASDYTTADVLVTFNVNLAGKSSVSNVPYAGQTVYINGTFLDGSWTAWNPIALNTMTENPPGSTNYTFSYLVHKGSLVRMQYKYGFDDGTSYDNEAPSGQDHVRYIRTTATGAYTVPNDTFGVQYGEPSFGELSAGPASGGAVAVKWLGRPGVRLQSSSTLSGGAWTDHFVTDGTNWSAGTSSTNGLVSSTNWPAASGNQFFRLIKQ